MTAVLVQMPDEWCSHIHADLPVYLEGLRGVAHTSREVADCGTLQSYARLRQDIILAVGRMDDVVVRLHRQEALLDESQAGPLLATIHQLRADKEGHSGLESRVDSATRLSSLYTGLDKREHCFRTIESRSPLQVRAGVIVIGIVFDCNRLHFFKQS